MSKETGKEADDDATADESIGRPAEWREGRYQKSGTAVDQSVFKKNGETPPDTLSTPVTKKDYEG